MYLWKQSIMMQTTSGPTSHKQDKLEGRNMTSWFCSRQVSDVLVHSTEEALFALFLYSVIFAEYVLMDRRFLYSVNLTEYVRMNPGCLSICVSVCLCVCLSVCLSVTALQPRRLGQFRWNFTQIISRTWARVVFLRFLISQFDYVIGGHFEFSYTALPRP